MIQMLHVDKLLGFIAGHMVLAYGSVFLVAFSESLALVGLIVPGTMIMFGIGAIISAGGLELVHVLVLAAAGAIAGDGISYWLGRHYRDGLKQVWPFSRYSDLFARGEVFFRRHGGKSILTGRFFGPVRPIIPVVAGALGMKPLHFSIVNIVSGIGWALVYVLPGVVFGKSMAMAGAVAVRLCISVFILAAVLWGFAWIVRRIPINVFAIAAIVLVIFAIAWNIIAYHKKNTPSDRSHRPELISLEEWTKGRWSMVSGNIADMGGTGPNLMFQWAGPAEKFAEYLNDSGWQPPSQFSIRTFLELFSPDAHIENMPVLQCIYDGRADRLCMVFVKNNTRFVLRLWPSGVRIKHANAPIFVGTIEHQRCIRLAGLVSFAVGTGNGETSMQVIEDSVPDRVMAKQISGWENPAHNSITEPVKMVLMWEMQ